MYKTDCLSWQEKCTANDILTCNGCPHYKAKIPKIKWKRWIDKF